VTTAPGAGATVATLAVPFPGLYEVSMTVYYTGTVGAGELDNVKLQSDPVTSGTFVDVMTLPLPNFAATLAAPPTPVHAFAYAQGTIKLIAIGAGGASALYRCSLNIASIATVAEGDQADAPQI
jgi:hypothetical protein